MAIRQVCLSAPPCTCLDRTLDVLPGLLSCLSLACDPVAKLPGQASLFFISCLVDVLEVDRGTGQRLVDVSHVASYRVIRSRQVGLEPRQSISYACSQATVTGNS